MKSAKFLVSSLLDGFLMSLKTYIQNRYIAMWIHANKYIETEIEIATFLEKIDNFWVYLAIIAWMAMQGCKLDFEPR